MRGAEGSVASACIWAEAGEAAPSGRQNQARCYEQPASALRQEEAARHRR